MEKELARRIIELKDKKEIIDKQIEEAKVQADALDREISELQDKLFEIISDSEEFKENHKLDKEICDGIYVTTFRKESTGYIDEEAVIKFLRNNLLNNLLTVKTSLNKKELNKELKTNTLLKEELSKMTTTKVTEWVTVTKADNHQRMLEHIEQGKIK